MVKIKDSLDRFISMLNFECIPTKLISIKDTIDKKLTKVARKFLMASLTSFRHAEALAPGFFKREKATGIEALTIKLLPKLTSKQDQDKCPIRPILPFERVFECDIKEYKTRGDFKKEEWKGLDNDNFILLQDYLLHLCGTCEMYDQQTTEIHDLGESKVSEALSKGLAYITENYFAYEKKIKIPSKQADGKYELVKYKIKITTVGEHFPVFVLTPTKPNQDHPIRIVFRGTYPYFETKTGGIGAKESLYADALSSRGIGAKVINEADLRKFEKYNLDGVIVTGHSLGGTLATILAVKLSERVEKIHLRVHGFNATGVDHEIANMYNGMLMKKNGEKIPEIIEFVAEGDIVSSAGKEWIGDVYGVVLRTTKKEEKNPFIKHTMHMLERGNTLFKVDVKKENIKFSRRISEGIRTAVGKVIGFVFRIRHKQPDWKRPKKVSNSR